MPQPLTKKQLQEWSQRNGEAFNGLMDINGLLPVSGDIQSGLLAANDVAKGNYGSAALNGLGLLPFVPSMAGMFIGKGSKLWDVLKADEAAKLAKAGLSPEEIWPKTGTFQGAEGAWRQEIPDNAAEPIMFGRSSYDIWKDMSKNDNSIRNIQDFINKHPTSPLTAEANKGTTVTAAYDNLPVDNPAQAKPISDFLSHDLLYSSYPDLANIKAGQEKGLDSLVNSGNASFSPDSNFIKYSKISSPEQFKSTTLHELQHAIQEREGWARGGSPEMFKSSTVDGLHSYDDMLHAEQIINMAKQYGKSVNEFMKTPPRWVTEKQVELAKIFENKSAKDLQYAKNYILEKTDPHTAYLNLAGEAEARATQARMNMTMPERLNTFPFDSYDVPKEQLIVRGLLGDSPVKAMSIEPTKYEKAHEVARQNAVKMLGLPENNTAMDRAKELGYTQDAYTGVNASGEIDSMAPKSWFSEQPEYASEYANVIPKDGISKEKRVYPVMIKTGKIESSPMFGLYDDMEKSLNKKNINTFKVENVGGGSNNFYVPKESNQVRSRFAAFDPARINESDLLGQINPALLPYLMGGGLLGAAGVNYGSQK